MHAVVVKVTIHNREAADSFLQENVVPGASAAPGFITGHWVRLDESRGTSMAVFESQEAAQGAADNAQFPPEDVVTVESVEIGEVVASA